jgi:hypothetical protein
MDRIEYFVATDIIFGLPRLFFNSLSIYILQDSALCYFGKIRMLFVVVNCNVKLCKVCKLCIFFSSRAHIGFQISCPRCLLFSLILHSVMATTTPPPSFTLRHARFSDLVGAARTCSLAFEEEELFGLVIHPHRKAFPREMDKYFYRRFLINYWDPSHVFLVTTERDDEQKRETVTGFAQWCRIAPEPRINHAAGWGLARCDPSKPSCHFQPDVTSNAD